MLRFQSKILKNKRRVFIYLPPNYPLLKGPSLPVLYMQDGQNLFSNTCHEVPFQWNLDKVADSLISRGSVPPFMIVGPANTPYREYEYTHATDDSFKVGGWADRYLDFLTEELMPFIESNYPVCPLRRTTFLGGSSLGGLLSLYAAFTRYESFGGFIATSPSIWWDSFSIIEVMDKSNLSNDSIRLWLDIGRREMKGQYIQGQYCRPLKAYRYLDDFLFEKGFQSKRNYYYYEQRLGTHDEKSWGKRMTKALPFLFKNLGLRRCSTDIDAGERLFRELEAQI